MLVGWGADLVSLPNWSLKVIGVLGHVARSLLWYVCSVWGLGWVRFPEFKFPSSVSSCRRSPLPQPIALRVVIGWSLGAAESGPAEVVPGSAEGCAVSLGACVDDVGLGLKVWLIGRVTRDAMTCF